MGTGVCECVWERGREREIGGSFRLAHMRTHFITSLLMAIATCICTLQHGTLAQPCEARCRALLSDLPAVNTLPGSGVVRGGWRKIFGCNVLSAVREYRFLGVLPDWDYRDERGGVGGGESRVYSAELHTLEYTHTQRYIKCTHSEVDTLISCCLHGDTVYTRPQVATDA